MISVSEKTSFARNRQQLNNLPHDKARILLTVDKEEKKLYCLILSKEKLEFKSYTESLTDNDVHKLVLTYTSKGAEGKSSDRNLCTFDLDLQGDTSKRKLLEVELIVEDSKAALMELAVASNSLNTNPPPPKSSVYYGDADA
ncbi:hypothetical protein [Cesiribacter sp. SM1]|uniref:hypothetical protein n=1 Tax=Cesiribacter sp. SM1 TaxID=2861196 RepID=UPI001CD2C747|nr:hypothetical protein [Cesiribacter sp. SM1]